MGNGTTEVLATNGTTLSGRSVVRAVWDGVNETITLNNNTPASAAVVPATIAGRLRIGSSPGGTASLFWNGSMREVIITAPLDTDQAAMMWAYTLARRNL